ncbi:MAG TPA: plastocyanin/azurin family copper-binding protein [Candidatus Binatia bacterium]|nr:plastocyanin/azurin family copper-binding protein [Candidatus Binatia bacterium]
MTGRAVDRPGAEQDRRRELRAAHRARSGLLFVFAATLASALLLAGCAGGRASPSPVATNTVDLPKSYRFDPAAITVPVGTTVTWTNHDNFTHNVHLFDDGGVTYTLRPGEQASFTFTTPGLHRYECSLHPQNMQASVLVTETN